jgi:hypothetical protein
VQRQARFINSLIGEYAKVDLQIENARFLEAG